MPVIEKDKWHVGKEIPVAMLAAMVVQTAGALWWAASLSAEVKYIKETQSNMILAQALTDKRQDDEAKRAEDRILQSIILLTSKVEKLAERRDRN